MKRVTGIIIGMAMMMFVFSGVALADDTCCLYGCGIIKGTVKLCGSFIGQEDAVVTLGGNSVKYFDAASTITDSEGFYRFEGQLPVCYIHSGTVTGAFKWLKCCGAPNELWKASASWRFRSFNQGEVITLIKNLKLLYFGTI